MTIKADKICKSYGSITILNDLSFQLEQGEKIGLIGSNGTGKSTLLKILNGEIQPDSGKVIIPDTLTIGYLPQDTSIVSDETIYEYVHRVSGMLELEQRMENPEFSADAVIEYEHRDGYSFYYRLDSILAGFGLSNISGNRSINSLSSGQKSKVFMAGVLLLDPDILLLDEPTNNLDLPALIWLESFLSKSNITCLLISHDRLFLDRVVRKIFEIDWNNRTLNITNGKYSDYLLRKEKERDRQKQQYYSQQEEIERLQEKSLSLKQKSSAGSKYLGSDNDKFHRGFKRDKAAKSGKQAKAIEKRIEQIDTVEKPFERDLFRIHLKSINLDSGQYIQLSNIISGYNVKNDFNIGPISLTIPFGSRIAILGLNGEGKTTLLKTISGELSPLSGNIDYGKKIILGNLTQEHDNLPRNETIKDFLMHRIGAEDVQAVYFLAVKFGFKVAELDKQISLLSPGGRARLLFAVFSAISVNVLILDEPTNHLDLEALEAVEEAVENFKGTVIVVSHDRRFLQKFNSTDIYVLSGGKLVMQKNFETYEADAERKAKNLINIT